MSGESITVVYWYNFAEIERGNSRYSSQSWCLDGNIFKRNCHKQRVLYLSSIFLKQFLVSFVCRTFKKDVRYSGMKIEVIPLAYGPITFSLYCLELWYYFFLMPHILRYYGVYQFGSWNLFCRLDFFTWELLEIQKHCGAGLNHMSKMTRYCPEDATSSLFPIIARLSRFFYTYFQLNDGLFMSFATSLSKNRVLSVGNACAPPPSLESRPFPHAMFMNLGTCISCRLYKAT